MKRALTWSGLILLAGTLLLPGAGYAQDTQAQQAGPPPRRDSVELRPEREVFAYPGFERRNPFQPLLGGPGGPRFELMRLQAIVYSREPGRSLATLTAGGGNRMTDTGLQVSRGESRRLRVGQSWGNVRVIEIRPDRVIVEVEEFGLAERREMRLENRSQGGSR